MNDGRSTEASDNQGEGEANFGLFDYHKSIDILKHCCTLQFLPYILDYENGYASKIESDGNGNNEKERTSTSQRFREDDCEASEYINQYGSYLNLDICACVCSASELPTALDAVLLAAATDEHLARASADLGMVCCCMHLYNVHVFVYSR